MNELSTGDLQRRLSKQEQKRQAKELEGEEGLSFQPAINEVPGVQSRLKVATEPKSYLARVRQHMKLKEQLTACVRERRNLRSWQSAPSIRRHTRRRRTLAGSQSR